MHYYSKKSGESFPGGVVYLYVCYHFTYHTYTVSSQMDR